jgi:hypothetical protein
MLRSKIDIVYFYIEFLKMRYLKNMADNIYNKPLSRNNFNNNMFM